MASLLNTINSDVSLNINNISNQNIILGTGGGNVSVGTGGLTSTSGPTVLGTTTVSGIFDVSGSRSGISDVNGKYLRISSGTYTDTATASSSTTSDFVFNSFNSPVLAATNTSVTTTHAATLFLASPTAGTNQTITNRYSLWSGGRIRSDGKLVVFDATAANYTAGDGSIVTSGGILSNATIHSTGGFTSIYGDVLNLTSPWTNTRILSTLFNLPGGLSGDATYLFSAGSSAGSGTSFIIAYNTSQVKLSVGLAGTSGTFSSTLGVTGLITASGGLTSTAGTTTLGTTTATSLSVSGQINMNNNKIINLATPTSSSDAVTKNYVDSVAQGLNTKASVIAATVVPGTLSTSFANGSVIDGVTLVTGDRILIKDQTVGTENGIYTVNVSGSPSRTTDFALGSSQGGSYVFVVMGTINDNGGFVVTNNKGLDIVGTDSIVFTQFSGAGQVIAGTGLTKTGNTLSVNNSLPNVTSLGTLTSLSTGALTGTSATFSSTLDVTGVVTLNNLTASQIVSTNGSKQLTSVSTTGSGNVVLANTPTLITPVIGAATGTSLSVTGGLVNGGFDFILGNTDQSTRGNSGQSRAIVKLSGNVLGINFASDFTGGTLVYGTLSATGTTTLLSAGNTTGAFATLNVAPVSTTSTATNYFFSNFATPTLTSGSAITVPNAYTIYIEGAPAQAGSTTITNPYSLYVNSGRSLFQTVTTSGLITANAGLTVASGTTTLGLTNIGGELSLTASTLGIKLNAADRPLITRSYDVFTSGIYNTAGRWGLFMEPTRLTAGIPAGVTSAFDISTYNLDSTVNTVLFKVTGATGVVNVNSLTASQIVATDSSKNLTSVAVTGSGSVVLANTPTLITPILGAATATTLNTGAITGTSATFSSTLGVTGLITASGGLTVVSGTTTLGATTIGAITGTSATFSTTTATTSSTTGSITTPGGISTSNTNNAISYTNGGSFTAGGGGAFARDLYVGGNSLVGTGTPVDGTRSFTVENTSTGTNAQSSIIIRAGGGIGGASLFLNGPNKPTDGGINTLTIRNDLGSVRLLNSGSAGISITSDITTSTGLTVNIGSSGTASPLNVYGTGSIRGIGGTTNSTSSFNVVPASTTLSGTSNYFFTYFSTPSTTGSTSGAASTVFIEGAPSGGIGSSYALYVNSGTTVVQTLQSNAFSANGLITANSGLTSTAGTTTLGTTTSTNLTVSSSFTSTAGTTTLGATTVGAITCNSNITATGNITSTNGSIIIGQNGTYTLGSIYSDLNWGMLFRARQASPSLFEYAFANSVDGKLLTISVNGTVTSTSTTPSTSGTTGGYTTPGGISSSNTTDSVSFTNGGGGTILGGFAVAKTLRVGTGINLNSLTASQIVATDSSKNLTSVAVTGSGSVVLANTPTLITPNIGAATATTLNTGAITGTSATFSGVVTLNNLTASQIVSTNGSKQLTSVDVTGTGNVVLANTPTLITPIIGVATGTSLALSGVLVNGGFDFVLGNTDQTTRGNSGQSRAMVKDATSKLVINFANDFTGGVDIQSALSVTGVTTLVNLTASQIVSTNGSKQLTSVATTGSGNVVLANTPTLITPILGAATATTLNTGAITGTSASFSGLISANGGITVATGQTTNIGTSGTSSPLNVFGLLTGKNATFDTSLSVTGVGGITSSGLISANDGITVANGKTTNIGTSGYTSPLNVYGLLTGAQGQDNSFYSTLTTASLFNMVMRADNDTGNKLEIYVNGSTRAIDGAPDSVTIRNNGGNLNLGSASQTNNFYGSDINIVPNLGSGNVYVTKLIVPSTAGFTFDIGGSGGRFDGPGVVGDSGTKTVVARFAGYVAATGYYATSDIRTKENIETIETVYNNKLNKLRPVTYNFIDRKRSNKLHHGLIAQEVESIYPECVNNEFGYIPNIMQRGQVVDKNKFKLTSKNENLKINKEIQAYITRYGEEKVHFGRCKIINIEENVYTIDAEFDSIFIYGTYENDVKSIDYMAFISILIADSQVKDQKINNLMSRIEKLETSINK